MVVIRFHTQFSMKNIIPIILSVMQMDPNNLTHHQHIHIVTPAQNISWDQYLYYSEHEK